MVTAAHRRRPAVTSILAAYAFAFLRVPVPARLLFALFMATLMLPIEVTLIPNVQTIRDLELVQLLPGPGRSRSSPPRSAPS